MVLGQFNPRRVVRDEDLRNIRRFFPSSVGIRVLVSGLIVLLYKSRQDLKNARRTLPQDVGRLQAVVDILRVSPTAEKRPADIDRVNIMDDDLTYRASVWSGIQAAARLKSSSNGSRVSPSVPTCIGLKPRLDEPGNPAVITTPTHAFITTRVSIRRWRNYIQYFPELWQKTLAAWKALIPPFRSTSEDIDFLSGNCVREYSETPAGHKMCYYSKHNHHTIYTQFTIWSSPNAYNNSCFREEQSLALSIRKSTISASILMDTVTICL